MLIEETTHPLENQMLRRYWFKISPKYCPFEVEKVSSKKKKEMKGDETHEASIFTVRKI